MIEYESGSAGFLGAVDCASLCMVSAGICLASVLAPREGNAEVAGARRGLWINLCFGDYIEAAYPLMERDPLVNFGAYVGAMTSGAILSLPVGGAGSSAYLPTPLAVALSSAPGHALLAFVAAFAVPFAMALVQNWRYQKSR